MNKISFGKYFDDQRDRIVSDMQHKRYAELHVAWREAYDKRQEKKKKHELFKKELEECNEKGVEISQECKTHFKKRFEWGRRNP